MLMTTQDLAFAVTGQKVYYYAPEGRPSSVTGVNLFDQRSSSDSASEDIGSGSVTTAPDTTIDANSGAGTSTPRVLNVAATTGFKTVHEDPHVQYLVTGAAGEREWFQVSEILSGVSVTASRAFRHAYVSGDTVEVTSVEATIDATWIANKNYISGNTFGPGPRWRLEWTYVGADGATYIRDSYFDVVRLQPDVTVTLADLGNFMPGLSELISETHEGDSATRLIAAAASKVKIEFMAADKADQLARDNELVAYLQVLGTHSLWAYGRYQETANPNLRQAWVDADQVYEAALDRLVRVVSKVPFSKDASGAAKESEGTPIWRR